MIRRYLMLGIVALLTLPGRNSVAAELKFNPPAVLPPENPTQRYFGRSVAIADEYIVVGEGDSELSGRAYAAMRMNDDWHVEELAPGMPPTDSEYGRAVAATSKTRVLVGAPPKAMLGGDLFAFGREGDGWLGEAVPAVGMTSYLGSAIAMSGMVALVADESFGNQQGAVYIYNHTGIQWQPVDTPAFPDTLGPGAHFGSALAILENVAVIGARSENNEQGAIYTVTLDASLDDWESPNPGGLPDSCEFGASVALHSAWIIVGAPGCSSGAGEVHVYHRMNKIWSKINVADVQGFADLGRALAIDGDNLVIGAPSMNSTGAVFLAVEQGGSWAVSPPAFAEVPADSGEFGISLAITGDRVIVGEPNIDADFDGSGDGRVHEFQIVGSLADPCTVAEDCATGVCADDVCCEDVACADDCWVCSVESMGKCQFDAGAVCEGGDGCESGVCRSSPGSTSEGSTGDSSPQSGSLTGAPSGGDTAEELSGGVLTEPTEPTEPVVTSDSPGSTSSGETMGSTNSGFDSLDWYPSDLINCYCAADRLPRVGDLLWLLPALAVRRRRRSVS